ncbi:MAG: CDP-diacylglycerol--inositol 3-phosphatidyltransferase [Candidatus Omnitrophica bacterium ADurb.Bin277]|jgi:CDP-diacylglycerol--glycerol-3-phosphate 3-phosphatidyltransferase|nr:MAG: CDP-diacylglycerol--inositol 3-phosphatidyltransferase [Candidatus Omnitrophica bacterium ADurb.Bin277]
MLRETLYPKIEALIGRIVHKLDQLDITPNQLTLAGAALNLLTGIIYAKGYLFLGALFLLLAGLGDMLDGPLARKTGKSSPFGAFLDSTVDRYSDFFIFGGLAVFFAREGEIFWFLVLLGIILGSFVVSYSKARAENFIENCGVGIFGRAERIVLLALGTLISPLLKPVLFILLVGTHATALQRIRHTKKALSESKASTD